MLDNFSFSKFVKRIEDKKDKISSIKEFKSLFADVEDNEEIKTFNRTFRIMAFKFLREDLLSYLFSNKKIKQIDVMLKYKNCILKGLNNPEKFVTWKDRSN